MTASTAGDHGALGGDLPRRPVGGDDQSADWVRKKHDEEHFDYLAAHSDKIRIGGGLRAAPGAWFCGGLWVLEVADRAEAVRLVEEDPYYKLGLRIGYELFVWGKAPNYGAVEL